MMCQPGPGTVSQYGQKLSTWAGIWVLVMLESMVALATRNADLGAFSAIPLFRVLSVARVGGRRTGRGPQLVQGQAGIPAEHSSPGVLIGI